jgi:parallel beta-helix repeat protein
MENLHQYRAHIYVFIIGLTMATIVIATYCYCYNPARAQSAPVPQTYYVDSVNGSDANNGTSVSTAWQTVAKVNATALNPGDSVLFEDGDVFSGSIVVLQSGASGTPITFGSYGSGANPIITGFNTLQNWKDDGGGIWESACTNCGTSLNMVTVNNAEEAMGRYPNIDAANGGYLTVQSFSGTVSITDSNLIGTPSWTGAQVVIRKTPWIIDRNLITGDSGSTLSYNSSSTYQPSDRFGYFIQNSPQTLDEYGEWYYNPATKVIQMYFGKDPSALVVQASALSTLLSLNNQSNIVVKGIDFQGANTNALTMNNSQNIDIDSVGISDSGIDAMTAANSSGLTIQNNTIQNTNNNAISFSGTVSNSSISGNTITDTAMIPGMGQSADGNYVAVILFGDGNTIQNNTITDTGYIPIYFRGNNTLIQNNTINGYAEVKDDGGGIYTYVGTGTPSVGEKIIGNTVLNGIGANNGVPSMPGYENRAQGIYLDNSTANITVTGNVVANNDGAGIYFHNSHDDTISSNVLFNNIKELWFNYQPGSVLDVPITDIALTNNTIAANDSSQENVEVDVPTTASVSTLGTFNNNAYIHQTGGNVFTTVLPSVPSVVNSLTDWQTTYTQDVDSQEIISDSPLFEYNATNASTTVPLDDYYEDSQGTPYNQTITLAPFTGTVLVKATPPSAPPDTPPASDSGSSSGSTPDTTPPTIALNGDSQMALTVGDSFTDPGATASDTVDGDLTPNITTTGSVDTTTAGTYTVTYSVRDSAGNGASVTRTVIVSAPATLLNTIAAAVSSVFVAPAAPTPAPIITIPAATVPEAASTAVVSHAPAAVSTAPGIQGPDTISDTIGVPTTAKKDYTIASVDYALNNVLVHHSTTFPDPWTLDTATLSAGTYTLVVTVHYADGRSDVNTEEFTVVKNQSLLAPLVAWLEGLVGR